MIEVEIFANTELLSITVESTNPGQAVEIANILGTLLVEQRENLYTGQGRSVGEILQDQLTVVEERLAEDRARLRSQLGEGADLEQGGVIQDLNARIQVQEQTYAMLLNEYEQAQLAEAARANSISVVEQAILPDAPIKPRKILNITLGALVGLVGGISLAFLLDNLDLTIYSADDLEMLAKLPLLGSIPRFNLPRGLPNRPILLRVDKQSHTREAFRILRTNVNVFLNEMPAKTLLITSAEHGAGKSTVLVNLAVSMAQAGRKVVMVDSNFRDPSLHELFGISNDWGLSTMITRPSRVSSSTQLVKTKYSGLRILASGPLPPNPGERISSIQMRKLIAELRLQADLVFFDSPAILAVADAAAVATMVDGVMLVAARGETTERGVHKTLQQLDTVGAKLMGVIFNKAEIGDEGF
jgi:non-specific protein-tyrosine kinase